MRRALSRTELAALKWFLELPDGLCLGNTATVLSKALNIEESEADEIIERLQELGFIAKLAEGSVH